MPQVTTTMPSRWRADDVRAAVREILPLAAAGAEEADRHCGLDAAVVAGLRRARVNQMLLPAALGGLELPFDEALAVVEAIAEADAAAGWVSFLWNEAAASAGTSLGDEGARAVYGQGPDILISGGGQPRGQARRVPGGYMIRGSWSYGSGIAHADWVLSGCLLMEADAPALNEAGAPVHMLVYHPRDTVVLQGNWDVIGLRGTGSFDYTLREDSLFIPDSLAYRMDAPRSYRGGVQYSVEFPGFVAWGHSGWAMGVSRALLDEMKRFATDRRDVFGLCADGALFRRDFAYAEAAQRSSRAFIYEAWGRLQREFARGDSASLEALALVRLAMHQAHHVLTDIAALAHRSSRGLSLRASPLQRLYRNAIAGTQHISVAEEIVPEIGRVLLGRAGADARWNHYRLVP